MQLPIQLANNLLMRWATADDMAALAQFNVQIHSDNPEEPDGWLGHWTTDLLNGNHPTTGPADFTVVVEQETGQIVSTLGLISQTWSYGGIPFGVGRVELVGTEPAYRRLGLVRQQMAVIHGLSAGRGELVQAITGIPYYYRRFGYEMTLPLNVSATFTWQKAGNYRPETVESYQLRPAGTNDIPILAELYELGCQNSLVSRLRSATEWHYELTKIDPDSMWWRDFQLVVDPAGAVVAYFELAEWQEGLVVREMTIRPGQPIRPIAQFVTRALKAESDRRNQKRAKPLNHLYFALGHDHPVIGALGNQLDRLGGVYAWYIRVNTLPFLRLISPVLEQRLAAGPLAGYTGQLRFNTFLEQWQMGFDSGRITTIDPFEPTFFHDGDAVFPGLTFLHLLFGHRSLSEIQHLFADCYTTNEDAKLLVQSLFPRQPSYIVPLA